MEKEIKWTISKEEDQVRLDQFLSNQLEEYTRSYLQKLCKDGLAKVDGTVKKGNFKLKSGHEVSIAIPEPTELEIEPEKMNLDIVYEDEDVILINKPKGKGESHYLFGY